MKTSRIRLLYEHQSPETLATDVILASTRRTPFVFEVHRKSDHEYSEHRTVGHQLMVNLGKPVRLGWLDESRRHEAEFYNAQLCIQSDGDSNAPRWCGDLTFATASIEPAMIEALLGERVGEVFPKRHCVDAEPAAWFARVLAGELLSPTEPLYGETLSLAFVLHLLAAHGRGPGRKQLAPKGKLGALQLRRVIELIHASLDAELSLETIARAAGYSQFQFARLFKATTGLAPHRFVLSLRLERACRLLAEDRGLADIALKTGFYDQAHLTNTFRRALGVTPSAMRKNFQSSGARAGERRPS